MHDDRGGVFELLDDRWGFHPAPMTFAYTFTIRPGIKELRKVSLSEHHRCLVSIPAGVWHSDRNVGAKDAVVINVPTQPFEHDAPDKLKLPLDTPRIPHTFRPGFRGG